MALPPRHPKSTSAPVTIHMMDRHYNLQEIAEKWGMSYEAVRERFQDEPGVLRWAAGAALASRARERDGAGLPQHGGGRLHRRIAPLKVERHPQYEGRPPG